MKKLSVKKGIECQACLACVNVCSETYYKEANQDKACIQITMKDGVVKPLVCIQCGKCAKACPARFCRDLRQGGCARSPRPLRMRRCPACRPPPISCTGTGRCQPTVPLAPLSAFCAAQPARSIRNRCGGTLSRRIHCLDYHWLYEDLVRTCGYASGSCTGRTVARHGSCHSRTRRKRSA